MMRDVPWSAALLLLVFYLTAIGLGGYLFWLAGAIR
jgi:hypothetical protein